MYEEGVLGAVFLEAVHVANKNNQIVGEKKDLYVTLEQLEEILLKVKERYQ